MDMPMHDNHVGIVQPFHCGFVAQNDLIVEMDWADESLLESERIGLGICELVMVAVNKVFVAVESGGPLLQLVKRSKPHVPKNIYDVILHHSLVPVVDDEGIVLLHCLELRSLKLNYPFMIEVEVRRYINCHKCFPFLKIEIRIVIDIFHELVMQVVFEPCLLEPDAAHMHRLIDRVRLRAYHAVPFGTRYGRIDKLSRI